MNLGRILSEALPETPPPRRQEVYPRVHPRLIVRTHQERLETVHIALIPGGKPPQYFRMNAAQLALVQLFDGNRSYEEVTELFTRQTGIAATLEEVKEVATILEGAGFWHRTPQEESALICQQLVDQRQKKLKRKQQDAGDLANIIVFSFDPDRMLTWAYRKLRFIYTPWFTAWSIFMLLVACLILGARWQQLWKDSVDFYTLTGNGFRHTLEFFGAFLALGAFHETAHGLTCKHFGGSVHRMGVFTIYLVPGVFCDVSQVWVYGDRWERIATVAAGVWSEIVICTYASVVWWLSPPGTVAHQIAYLTILSGGIFCVLVNWNPLSKMDGYFLFSEYLRIPDLKGISTHYLAKWVSKNIFRMPVTVPEVTRKQKIGFAVYAVLSGVFCYSMLLYFVRIIYHVVFYYSPLWAFAPASALALVIFRSRIEKLGRFMRELYLDKLPLIRQHGKALTAAVLMLLVLGSVPLRRERVNATFLLEPVQRAVLRAPVPGLVAAVNAREGQAVQAGEAVARLRNVNLESNLARARAEFITSSSRNIEAQLRYGDYAGAEQQKKRAAETYRLAGDEVARELITSPIAGIVLTPRVQDRENSWAEPGTLLAEIGNTSVMRARIYVPEPEMDKLEQIDHAVLRPQSAWRSRQAQVESVSPASQQPDPGLLATSKYAGTRPPDYFVVTVLLANRDGQLRDGMTGTAKIYGRRTSFLRTLAQPAVNAVARRLW